MHLMLWNNWNKKLIATLIAITILHIKLNTKVTLLPFPSMIKVASR